jgi:hypothetical protein
VSAPPVRIESKAWTDLRYQTLALLLGLPRPSFALILMAEIWRWQTEHYTDESPTYAVGEAVVMGALGLDGPSAILRAGLAELQDDGLYRIRGGRDDNGKSRIDWLYRSRQSNREKGLKRHAQAGDRTGVAGGRFQPSTSRAPAEHQPEPVQTPAGDQPATSSPDSGLRTPDLISVSPAGEDSIASLVEHAYEQLDAARIEIDPTATPCQRFTERPLVDRLMATPTADRRRRLGHCLAVLTARARAAGKVDDLRMGYLGGERAWPALCDATVAGAGQPRGRDGPQRRTATGRAPPAATHSTDVIDPKDITP